MSDLVNINAVKMLLNIISEFFVCISMGIREIVSKMPYFQGAVTRKRQGDELGNDLPFEMCLFGP